MVELRVMQHSQTRPLCVLCNSNDTLSFERETRNRTLNTICKLFFYYICWNPGKKRFFQWLHCEKALFVCVVCSNRRALNSGVDCCLSRRYPFPNTYKMEIYREGSMDLPVMPSARNKIGSVSSDTRDGKENSV